MKICICLLVLFLAACSAPATTMPSVETQAEPIGAPTTAPTDAPIQASTAAPPDAPAAATEPEPFRADLEDLGPAPELENEVWLNVDRPLRLADLRGKVVLLDMWTFG